MMMTDVCIDPPCPISRHDNDREGAEVRSHLTEASFDRDIIGAAGTFHQLSIDEDGWLRSSNYVEGVSGYQLTDTRAQFNEGDYRGTLTLSDNSEFLRMMVSDTPRGLARPGVFTISPIGGGIPTFASGIEIVALEDDGETEGVRLSLFADPANNVEGAFIQDGDLTVAGGIGGQYFIAVSPSATSIGGDRTMFQTDSSDPATGETAFMIRLEPTPNFGPPIMRLPG